MASTKRFPMSDIARRSMSQPELTDGYFYVYGDRFSGYRISSTKHDNIMGNRLIRSLYAVKQAIEQINKTGTCDLLDYIRKEMLELLHQRSER